jgi:hypothetical protein
VGIIREASNAVRAMPMILVFPLIPSALGMALMSYWLVAAGYLASSGTLLTDAADVTRTGGGPMGMGANATVAYYQTDEWVGKALVFHFFGLLWTKEFIYGFGVVTIAGSVADYYWCVDKKTLTSRPVWTSARRALRYHTGTLAMGSLIIAFITLCRAVLEYIDKQSKRLQDRNCAVKLFMCSFRCCLWCFEKCVRFVSTQGYIITSIKGAGFCKGTMQAFALLWKHLAKVGTVHIMASFILRLGSVCVVSVSSMAMLKLINDPPASFWIPIIGTVNTLESAGQAVAQVSSPILPLLATMLLAYAVSSYVLTVYSMAIDTLLMCFCEDLTVVRQRWQWRWRRRRRLRLLACLLACSLARLLVRLLARSLACTLARLLAKFCWLLPLRARPSPTTRSRAPAIASLPTTTEQGHGPVFLRRLAHAIHQGHCHQVRLPLLHGREGQGRRRLAQEEGHRAQRAAVERQRPLGRQGVAQHRGCVRRLMMMFRGRRP